MTTKLFSEARWAGDLLLLSGQVGLNPETGELADNSVVGQTLQAMQNLGDVLARAGLTWQHLVKAKIYLADIKDYGAVNEVYVTFFKDCPEMPARVCLQVGALPLGAKVEIEGIALRETAGE